MQREEMKRKQILSQNTLKMLFPTFLGYEAALPVSQRFWEGHALVDWAIEFLASD